MDIRVSRIPGRLCMLGLFLAISTFAAAQAIEKIDSLFADSDLAILTEVNGQPITHTMPVLQQIVGKKTGSLRPGVSVENRKFDQAYNLYGASFQGPIYLNVVDFLKPCDLTLCTFPKPFVLQTANMHSSAYFNWASFHSSASFIRVLFDKDAQFARCQFDSAASFKFCRFKERAFFYGSLFSGVASFKEAKFHKEAIFSFTTFKEKTGFDRAEFLQIARFNNAVFEKGTSFQLAKFDSLADFSNATIHGKVDFSGIELPRYFDFSGLQDIDELVDLMQVDASKLDEPCKINLYNANIAKFKFDYENFALYFPDGVTYDEKVNVYEALLDNFKTNEFSESYEKLDIEFSQFKHKEKHTWATNFVQKAWWNYGYDKNMIFVWIFRILIFFTVINTFFINRLINAISELPFLTKKAVEKNNLHHPIIAYFLNFPGTLLYTTIMILSGATGLSIIKDHTRIPSVVWMIYMIILSIIGFGLSLFIFNFIIN